MKFCSSPRCTSSSRWFRRSSSVGGTSLNSTFAPRNSSSRATSCIAGRQTLSNIFCVYCVPG
ncbi:hypothetical protein AK51_26485 [Serratia nematodiphila DZ0503SBS1]|nr:hypothetical protein AK51_26485 [Serratia nematodiphila DZ0503SBS1]